MISQSAASVAAIMLASQNATWYEFRISTLLLTILGEGVTPCVRIVVA
jgi:hypothetical protein